MSSSGAFWRYFLFVTIFLPVPNYVFAADNARMRIAKEVFQSIKKQYESSNFYALQNLRIAVTPIGKGNDTLKVTFSDTANNKLSVLVRTGNVDRSDRRKWERTLKSGGSLLAFKDSRGCGSSDVLISAQPSTSLQRMAKLLQSHDFYVAGDIHSNKEMKIGFYSRSDSANLGTIYGGLVRVPVIVPNMDSRDGFYANSIKVAALGKLPGKGVAFYEQIHGERFQNDPISEKLTIVGANSPGGGKYVTLRALGPDLFPAEKFPKFK